MCIRDRVIPFDSLLDLVREPDRNCPVVVHELEQKGAETYVTIVLAFVAGGFFNGFFGEMGKDVYTVVKDKLKSLAEAVRQEQDADLECHISFSFERHGDDVEILVAASVPAIEQLTEIGLTAEQLQKRVREAALDKNIRKAVFAVTGDPAVLTLTHIIDREENFHRIDGASDEGQT